MPDRDPIDSDHTVSVNCVSVRQRGEPSMSASMKREGVVIAILLVGGVIAEVAGLFPGLTYLTQSFPTHHHRIESAVIVVILLASLGGLISDHAHTPKWSVSGACSLMFLATAKIVVRIDSSSSTPIDVLAFWTFINLVVVGLLAWIVISAFLKDVIGWRDLFFSLVVANAAFAYLLLVS